MNIELCPKQYEKALNYYDALLYCSLLEIDDRKDWRMPTYEELLQFETKPHDFDGYYWTLPSEYGTMGIKFGSNFRYITKDNIMVRPVRTIEPS
jgi:hypothetical protein